MSQPRKVWKFNHSILLSSRKNFSSPSFHRETMQNSLKVCTQIKSLNCNSKISTSATFSRTFERSSFSVRESNGSTVRVSSSWVTLISTRRFHAFPRSANSMVAARSGENSFEVEFGWLLGNYDWVLLAWNSIVASSSSLVETEEGREKWKFIEFHFRIATICYA